MESIVKKSVFSKFRRFRELLYLFSVYRQKEKILAVKLIVLKDILTATGILKPL